MNESVALTERLVKRHLPLHRAIRLRTGMQGKYCDQASRARQHDPLGYITLTGLGSDSANI